MPILTKELQVKLWGNNIKHYYNMGYKGKYGDIITVKTEDLSNGCNARIEYLCDYCNEEIITMTYADLMRRKKEVNKMACKNCFTKKMSETVLLRYGTPSYAQTDEYRKNMENMMISRYGVRHYSQTQEFKEKWHKTCMEKYGESYRKKFIDKAFETFKEKTGYDYPTQCPEVKEKMVQSYIDHYGVFNPQLCEEIRERTAKTNLERYGGVSPATSQKVKAKMAQTSYRNGTVPTSKQQIYLYNLYCCNRNVELNYPISRFNADICLLDENLTIEADLGGHNLSVKTGQITQEEFNRKEIIRNNTIKNEGYKQMRIISTTDKLPSDQVLLEMLDYTRNYFSLYPRHSWIEYNIDTSTVRNAEHKDGIPYDFGTLRTIKDSDLTEAQTEIETQTKSQNKKGA